MNTLVKKEVRLLLPAWCAAMLLAVVPCWIIQYFEAATVVTNDFPPPLFIMLGMLFLGITSFGNELSFKTFPLLLSQPVPRDRIWRVKVTLLGAAFLSILAASIISWSLFVLCHPDYSRLYFNAFSGVELWIFVFAFSSGGLWATLLIRQTIGAFWVALFAPVAISVVINLALLPWPISDNTLDNIISVAGICYAIAGFLYAHNLFMHAQDTQWLEGVFTLTWRKNDSEQATGSVSQGQRHWLVALILKELQLHQVNFLVAVVVLVLHVSALLVRKVHPHFEDPYIRYILDAVWALWLLIPLLIGCSAIAEERKLAVIESQLCLPVSRRAQLFTKLLVALAVSLALGGVMPSLIERIDMDGWIIFIFAAVIFFISFYASSLSRTTIQAIGLAILTGAILIVSQMAFAFVSFKFNPFLNRNQDYGYILLEIFLAAILLLLLFVWLAFRNFKWLHQIGKVLWHDAIALGLSFVAIVVLTNAIYFRTWEFLMASEPSHGPACLAASTLPKFFVGEDAIYALMPDGRLWAQKMDSYSVGGWGDMYMRSGKQSWIGDSNWMAAAVDGRQGLTIQSNGTLWEVQSFRIPGFKLNRLGLETNWTQIVSAPYWTTDFSFLLLKGDGTLWVSSGGELPQQVIGGTNFASVISDPEGSLRAVKEDGSIWYVGYNKKNPIPRLYRSTKGSDFIWDVPLAGGHAMLDTNGDLTFSFYRRGPFKGVGHYPNGIPIAESEKEIPIGGNAKWKAIAPVANFGFNSFLLAVRDDGTLWQFKAAYFGPNRDDADLESWLKQIRIIQLGIHSDWLALLPASEEGYGTRPIALAADGGLWIWDQPSDRVWLAPSRRPAYMGSIFQDTSETP